MKNRLNDKIKIKLVFKEDKKEPKKIKKKR
jgi:hypothetical protein